MAPKRAGSVAVCVALVLALLSSIGCDTTVADDEHVLNRIGFGGDAWSRARIRQLGIQGYIDEQLHPETLDDSGLEADIAARYPLTTWSLQKVRSTYNEYNTDPSLLPGAVRQQMSYARMLRDAHSKRQLEQVLVDFWHNHFNVDARTEIGRWGVVTYEREAIRPFVLGRFRDMLGAVAQHPSMLDYLDNADNFIPGYIRGTTKFGPNENYGRELLELHTVGVDAGYTLQDIQEVARAFTGWTINRYNADGSFNYYATSFVYEDAGHDKGSKSIMGSLFIPSGGGMSDGKAVLDFLAQRPETAHHIALKLAQRFVADDPPAALVDRAAGTFQSSGGDLRAVTRTILLSSEFLGTSYRGKKVKRPQHYLASLARTIGIVDDGQFAQRAAAEATRMGEDLYAAAPPTGYPEESSYWLGEGPFVFRMNVATWASFGLYGFGPPVSSAFALEPDYLASDLAHRLVPVGVRATTIARLSDLARQLSDSARVPGTAATLLAGPEFAVH